MPQPRQPFLHDLVTVFAAPTQVLSGRSGEIDATAFGRRAGPSAEGVLHADVRVLSRATLTFDGRPGEHIATQVRGREATFTWLLRHVGADLGGSADPQVRLDRVRRVAPAEVGERLELSSVLTVPVTVDVELTFAADLAGVETIKAGQPSVPRPFPNDPTGGVLVWGDDGSAATLTAPEAVLDLAPDRTAATARWRVTVPALGRTDVGWSLLLRDAGAAVVAAPSAPPLAFDHLLTPATDQRLRPWLERSLVDLDSLRMARPEAPDDVFFAAGAPWYLTLFGRDSIWAARMLLPLDLGPARGTLRTLAALQGSRTDDDTAEQPGKVMHELRRSAFALGAMSLPPLYYGTIDATPLWVCLLYDAWRAGLPESEVAELLPHLERALTWLTESFDADGDGFGEYLDGSGHGLANQGWKDSADSVRFCDGTVAAGPVALCEVQGYAYEAAVAGADVLDAYGRPGGERLRAWASELAVRFRASFWCGTGEDRYPALALDGRKRRVDSLTSNIGHLLGTGLLNTEEERLVATRVSGAALESGLGLRTMAVTDVGYSPLSYHCGWCGRTTPRSWWPGWSARV